MKYEIWAEFRDGKRFRCPDRTADGAREALIAAAMHDREIPHAGKPRAEALAAIPETLHQNEQVTYLPLPSGKVYSAEPVDAEPVDAVGESDA